MIVKKNLVTATEVKQSAGADFNVDDALITPMIRKAQDMYIGQALGSTFYNHIMSASTSNTLTSDETALIDDYIKPCLLEWSILSALSVIKTKTTNKGVNTENAQYVLNADRADYKEKKQEIRDFAEFYLKRLNKYLCDYSNLFPLFENPSDLENLRKNGKSFFGGMYLPRTSPNNKTDQYKYNN